MRRRCTTRPRSEDLSLSDCGPECEQALAQIERFLDGECDPGVRAFVDKHLSDCVPCTERAEFRRHLKNLLAAKCREQQMPAGLSDRVRSLIENLEA